MLPDVNDEAQPKAPVALVTMEIRHPSTDALTESSRREVKQALAADLPIERQAQDVQWGTTAAGQPPQPVADRFVRYSDRNNTTAASLKNQAIVVETTAYTNFDAFLEIAKRVVDARSQVSPIVGIERIGLRFVLEVRVPAGVDGRIEWTNWIDESLLGPQQLNPGGLALAEWQGAAVYREPQPGRALIVRYGPATGQALDPSYHLRRVAPTHAGQFFLMDIDSFWTPPSGAIPEYNREALISTYQDLYRPAQTIFQDVLTSRLKEELLRTEGA
ncbi:TIGR04255 family protein [Mycobacterium sp.]|uniref:TIGR04255 family protein n=1 Tax=Mycobacterium sp. TaxID=1785 RepID=UPI003A8ADCAE